MKNRNTKQSGLRCRCGYDFSHAADIRRQRPRSFAVVSDKDYQTFLKLETKVLQARGDNARLRAIARSSEYVGCLLECPECSRVLLLKPSAGSSNGSSALYRRED